MVRDRCPHTVVDFTKLSMAFVMTYLEESSNKSLNRSLVCHRQAPECLKMLENVSAQSTLSTIMNDVKRVVVIQSNVWQPSRSSLAAEGLWLVVGCYDDGRAQWRFVARLFARTDDLYGVLRTAHGLMVIRSTLHYRNLPLSSS